MPMLGIGLGHEVIAAACGANVVKMKVGHHENSSPVQLEERENRVYCTGHVL